MGAEEGRSLQIKVKGLEGKKITRPNIAPALCGKCTHVIAVLLGAAEEFPDASELHAACVSIPNTAQADVTVNACLFVGGNPPTETKRVIFCHVAKVQRDGTEGH